MKAKLLAAALLLAATPAAAITYTYESGLYASSVNHELFGDRMTGTVVTNDLFVSPDFTGRLYTTNVTSFSITSGIYTFDDRNRGGNYLDLVSGEVTGWYIGTTLQCFPGGPNCVMETGSGPFIFTGIYPQCHGCLEFQHSAFAGHGGWTIVAPLAVPGPTVGAGVPALMMLIAWLMARRRCARSC